MKSTIVFALFTLFSITFLESCFVYRAVHIETADVGFFKGKNEGNVTFNYDANDVTGKLGGQFSYAVGDNVFVGLGGNVHSIELQKGLTLFTQSEFNDNEYKLGGISGKLFVGYFNNFGSELKGYTETALTVSTGPEKLTIFDFPNSVNRQEYKYSPLGIALQSGLGINTEKVGFLGGVKLNFISFNKNLPLDYYAFNSEMHSKIFYTQIFAAGRFGKGPVKANIQLSVVHNLYLWDDGDNTEFFPVVGLGITYNWGRKNPKILNL